MENVVCFLFSACDWVKTLSLNSGWWWLLFYHLVFDFWWCSCMLQPVVLYYPHLAALWGCVFERIHSCQTKRWELQQNCQLYSPPLSVYPCAVQTYAILILRSFTNVHRKIDCIVLSANISYIIQIYQQQCAHHRLETKQSKWSHLDNSKQVSQY